MTHIKTQNITSVGHQYEVAQTDDYRTELSAQVLDSGTVVHTTSSRGRFDGSKFDDFIITINTYYEPAGTGWTNVTVWSVAKEERVFSGSMEQFLTRLTGEER